MEKFIIEMKKDDDDKYLGTIPILESEPINIPNAKKCRANHGLVTAVPCEDMTFEIENLKNLESMHINDDGS